jgi:hypothetical protein
MRLDRNQAVRFSIENAKFGSICQFLSCSIQAHVSGETMTASHKAADQEVKMDRRWKKRRAEDAAQANDAETGSAPPAPHPARRKKERRRQIDPTTCERDYNDEEINFMRALDDYKRSSGRMFPTCSEILEVVMSLGYVKLTEEERQIFQSIQEVEGEIAEACGKADESLEDGSLDLS